MGIMIRATIAEAGRFLSLPGSRIVAYNEKMSAPKAFSFKTRVLLGTLIVLLAIVLLAGGWTIPFRYPSLYTISKKYYPEFVGMGLIFVLLTLSLSAIFRKFLQMPYPRWRLVHRMGATLVLAILPVHVLLVSSTFKSAGLPRYGAIAIFSLNFLFILYIWLKRIFHK